MSDVKISFEMDDQMKQDFHAFSGSIMTQEDHDRFVLFLNRIHMKADIAANERGYDDGYSDGYSEGYSKGYNEGEECGCGDW